MINASKNVITYSIYNNELLKSCTFATLDKCISIKDLKIKMHAIEAKNNNAL